MPIPLAHFEPPKNKPYKYIKATILASTVSVISPGKVKKVPANPTMQAVVMRFENKKSVPLAQNGNTLYPLGRLATSCNVGRKADARIAARIAHSLKPWNPI